MATTKATATIPQPVTPTKPRQSVAVYVEELNNRYNLGLPFSENPLTPSERERRSAIDSDFNRHQTIISRLRFQSFQHDDPLRTIFKYFDVAARAVERHWIRKPSAVLDLPPTSTDDPKASTSKEQMELQEILLDLLEQANPKRRHQPNILQYDDAGHCGDRTLFSKYNGSKRISDKG